jgi:hypothetical protein
MASSSILTRLPLFRDPFSLSPYEASSEIHFFADDSSNQLNPSSTSSLTRPPHSLGHLCPFPRPVISICPGAGTPASPSPGPDRIGSGHRHRHRQVASRTTAVEVRAQPFTCAWNDVGVDAPSPPPIESQSPLKTLHEFHWRDGTPNRSRRH